MRSPTYCFLCLMLVAGPTRADSQTRDAILQPDSVEVVRPAACPLYANNSAMGYVFGYENAGYWWVTQWYRREVLDLVDYARAKYAPSGDPYFLLSTNHEARWYNPAFIAHCVIHEVRILGYVMTGELVVIVDQNLGRVVKCATGGTGGPIAPSYDIVGIPRASPALDVEAGGCSDDPADGGGGGGGPTNGQVCTTIRTDYYWYYPDTGQWEYRYSDETTSCTTMT